MELKHIVNLSDLRPKAGYDLNGGIDSRSSPQFIILMCISEYVKALHAHFNAVTLRNLCTSRCLPLPFSMRVSFYIPRWNLED